MSALAQIAGAATKEGSGGLPAYVLAAHIDRLIAAIDAALTRQLNAILHSEPFAALEARWRAVAQLVDQSESGEGDVIIRLLDANWRALSRDLERAADFDRSHLFHLIYDEEFGMPGGLPFGVIVADFSASARTEKTHGDQVNVLRRLSAVGAAAFCPIIMGAAPEVLGLSTFTDLRPETDVAPEMHPSDALRWSSLRREEDARFLGLVAPRIVIRQPYLRHESARADGFTFDEDPTYPLFANGAFAFAATLMTAFQDSGWFAAIRGAYQDAPGGGRVTTYAPFDIGTDQHWLAAQPPVETRLTAAQEESLIGQGVVTLCPLYLEPAAVFNANPSLHQPKDHPDPIAAQNAKLASMLQYVLCTSRFAHYLKVIIRDEIGALADPSSIQTQLSDWLRQYCLGNDDASDALKAQYPLRNAGVAVAPLPGRPGAYSCTIHLQPHFQLDDIATSFHLIAETSAQTAPQRSIA